MVVPWFIALFAIVTTVIMIGLLVVFSLGVQKLWRASGLPASVPPLLGDRTCGRGDCGCVNPSKARFCRRCGSALQADARAGTAAA